MVNKIKAYELAKAQREISISEFFTKNRHLLGFDNPARALLMVTKEACDNALDATQEMQVLPDIIIIIKQLEETKFKLTIEDNGPGIVKQQIPNIFGKLLYGSKFHRLVQSMGQQGLGISMAVLYSQLTTGKATKITSKIDPKKKAYYYELQIDTTKNLPKILKEEIIEWEKDHGTKIELEIEGKYLKGRQSVDEYVKQISIVNPHAEIIYINPLNEKIIYKRVTDTLPILPKEIKPHPYGVELGTLIVMLKDTKANTLAGFLQKDFSGIGLKTALDVCKEANLNSKLNPRKLNDIDSEKLYKSIQKSKFIAPPTDCLSPISSELLEKSLKKEINAEFYTSISRRPAVYRGMPFQIECSIAYGGDLETDNTIKLMRFANRVPLLYQQGACAITEAVSETNWKPYGLQQSGNNLPVGPAIILVHIASVWVPFTSEAKDAVAHYPEIIREIKLVLQDCGRELGRYLSRKNKSEESERKKSYLEKYLPHIGIALKEIINLNDIEEEKAVSILKETLEKSRQ